jgi:hypothetical protein
MAAKKAPIKRIGRETRLFPPASSQKKKAAKLTKFPPHRLEDLIEGKLSDSEKQVTADVMIEIQRRNEAQLEQLIGELGIKPDHPEKWRRAFYELAYLHHGVGVISWRQPRGPNFRASKWNDEHDLNFVSMVQELMGSGLSLTDALRSIARDPEKWGKLAPQPKNFRSETSEVDRRVAALKKHWPKAKTIAFRITMLRAFGASSNLIDLARPPLPPEGKI